MIPSIQQPPAACYQQIASRQDAGELENRSSPASPSRSALRLFAAERSFSGGFPMEELSRFLELGCEAFHRGDYAEAWEYANRGREALENYASYTSEQDWSELASAIYYPMGICSALAGEYERGWEEHQKALEVCSRTELSPAVTVLHDLLTGRIEAASREILQNASLDNLQSALLHQAITVKLGKTVFEQSDFQEAIEKLSALDQPTVENLRELAFCLAMTGDLNAAKDSYDRLCEMFKGSEVVPQLFMERATVAFMQGRYEEAEQLLRFTDPSESAPLLMALKWVRTQTLPA